MYTSALNRIAGLSPDEMSDSMAPLLDKILQLPKPIASAEDPLQLQISSVDSDLYIGARRVCSSLLRLQLRI